jgi:TolB-like protein/DNA-binding winged helix-turn-helix (wHTH) protein
LENPQPLRGTLRIGVFEVDVRAGELRRQGTKIKLQDQPFQVLLALLEKPGEVLTREELQRRVWPAGTFIDFEHGVNNAIRKLREALGDSAENPRFVETLSRRGYRFIAPVTAINEDAEVRNIPARPATEGRRWLHWWSIAAVVVVLAAATFLVLRVFRVRDRVQATAVPQIRSLAVLPFDNLSGDPAQEYFSDGMTDALITNLAQISSAKVISRTSSLRYKKSDKPLPDIARELNVDAIIEGTVQRSGDRVRITAQLIHAPMDKHLWANSYEEDVRDLFMLEREVAGDIADKVQARLTPAKQTQAAQRTISSQALEAYLQGNAHMHKFWRGAGDEELDLASQDFQRAIDAQADFAPAYVGLSSARRSAMRSSDEDVETARRAAERAVEIDPNLSDAWTALANIRSDFWNWAEAEQDYRRALALNPSDADAHQGLGFILDAFGRMDEGWKEAQLAQQLDPWKERLEPALGNRRQFDQIIQHETTMLQSDPDSVEVHAGLFEAYAGKGMYKEAFEQWAQTMVLGGFPKEAAELRHAFARSGSPGAWRQMTEAFEHLHATHQAFMPLNLASFYAYAGNKDRAFYWLDQACKYPGHAKGVYVVFLNRDPNLEPLRSDPRYKELLRLVGLPS